MPCSLTSARRAGLAGGGGGTHLDHHLAAQALDPGGRRGARDDDLVVADVGHGQRIHGQAAHGEAGHLGLGIGAAHAVGVHHRQAHQRGHHEGLQAVAAADFQRHDGAEALAAVFLHHAHRLDREMRIGQPFLADQRRAHARDHRHAVVLVQVHGVQQRGAIALLVKLAHVEQFLVRITAAAGAQYPGAHGQGFHLFGGHDARSGLRACGYR